MQKKNACAPNTFATPKKQRPQNEAFESTLCAAGKTSGLKEFLFERVMQ